MKSHQLQKIYAVLLFCLMALTVQAQQRINISGVVQDEHGDPLPRDTLFLHSQ